MAVNITGQPSGLSQNDSYLDKLLAYGPFKTRAVTLLQDAALGADLARGSLLCPNGTKYVAPSTTETTVAITAAGGANDLLVNDVGAGVPLEYDVTLTKPPIPGTVQIVTTLDGSATPVKNLGLDNGRGFGQSADGFFTIDYNTGRLRIVFATVPTDNDDIKAAFKYRALAAGSLGLPSLILAEDIPQASLVAGDVVSVAYELGSFQIVGVPNYSAGYLHALREVGILLV